jgi:hypothetical protein
MLVLTTAWAAMASGADARRRRPALKCYPRKAVTLQASEGVRVYRRRDDVVACSLRNGRKTRLGAVAGSGGNEVVSLSVGGRYAAYALGRLPKSAAGTFASQTLALLDARTGRPVAFGGQGCDQIPDATVSFPSLAVTPSRQFAWICVGSSATAGRVEVHRFDRTGSTTLDLSTTLSGPDAITATSLAISRTGNVVYWSRPTGAAMAPLS